MGRISYFLIAILIMTGTAEAATVIGQAKFTSYSTNRAIKQAATDAHISATTAAHGGIVASSDARLTDARTPTTHDNSKHSATYVTATEIATHAALTTGVHGAGANSLVYSNDSRLTDSRTPTAHNQTASTISDFSTAVAALITDKAATGAVGSSGLTQNTGKLLGRNTASAGAIEEITLGTNLSFSGTTLNAAGGSGAPTTSQYWVGAADVALSNEKDLSGFTGLVLNTAGTPTSKATNTCTNQFPRSDTASGVWTCASIAATDLPAMNKMTMTRLTATWASSATINTLGIIGTAGVPMTSPTYGAGAPFSFHCAISTTRASTTNGPRYGVTTSATVTRVSFIASRGATATTRAFDDVIALTSGTCTTGCTAAQTTAVAQVMTDLIDGTGIMNASGTISLQMAPSAAAANTAQIGSYCIWY
jgi:hypothetical protein